MLVPRIEMPLRNSLSRRNWELVVPRIWVNAGRIAQKLRTFVVIIRSLRVCVWEWSQAIDLRGVTFSYIFGNSAKTYSIRLGAPLSHRPHSPIGTHPRPPSNPLRLRSLPFVHAKLVFKEREVHLELRGQVAAATTGRVSVRCGCF
jgi:hypothetical protein